MITNVQAREHPESVTREANTKVCQRRRVRKRAGGYLQVQRARKDKKIRGKQKSRGINVRKGEFVQ